jgi:hypothetical protein
VDLDRGQQFHNAYEHSKFEAERRVRQARRVRATVYRPSVIVGDSRTGYTSAYHGFYRFIELATRLAEPAGPVVAGTTARRLPIRLPFTADEPRNVVPVDYVAQAVVRLLHRPDCHGQTFHLVSQRPVPVRLIKEAAEEVLNVGGTRWAGPGVLACPSRLERLFLDHLREYWPYFHGDPVFDCRNLRAALPEWPPAAVDRDTLKRLIRFAVADNWGDRAARAHCNGTDHRSGVSCAHYIEEFFPLAARQSTLSRTAGLNLVIALDIRGPGGGKWSCEWVQGELASVERGLDASAEVVYRTDTATFADVVLGHQSPQEAFFARRIEIEGDMENALKLPVLFGHFLREFPYEHHPRMEAPNAVALPI